MQKTIKEESNNNLPIKRIFSYKQIQCIVTFTTLEDESLALFPCKSHIRLLCLSRIMHSSKKLDKKREFLQCVWITLAYETAIFSDLTMLRKKWPFHKVTYLMQKTIKEESNNSLVSKRSFLKLHFSAKSQSRLHNLPKQLHIAVGRTVNAILPQLPD